MREFLFFLLHRDFRLCIIILNIDNTNDDSMKNKKILKGTKGFLVDVAKEMQGGIFFCTRIPLAKIKRRNHYE